jgi:hypothetical protein
LDGIINGGSWGPICGTGRAPRQEEEKREREGETEAQFTCWLYMQIFSLFNTRIVWDNRRSHLVSMPFSGCDLGFPILRHKSSLTIAEVPEIYCRTFCMVLTDILRVLDL